MSLRTWEIDVEIDLSSLKVCAAKHDSDQKIHSLFLSLEAPIKLKSRDEFKIHEKKESGAEMKTQELKLRLKE